MTHCYMDFIYFSFIPDTNSFLAQCRPQIQKQEVFCFEHSGLGVCVMRYACMCSLQVLKSKDMHVTLTGDSKLAMCDGLTLYDLYHKGVSRRYLMVIQVSSSKLSGSSSRFSTSAVATTARVSIDIGHLVKTAIILLQLLIEDVNENVLGEDYLHDLPLLQPNTTSLRDYVCEALQIRTWSEMTWLDL